MFESNPDFWADRQYWAPEMHKYGDKYHMFASFCAEGKHRATHILVSDAPDQRFVPLTKEPITPRKWDCKKVLSAKAKPIKSCKFPAKVRRNLLLLRGIIMQIFPGLFVDLFGAYQLHIRSSSSI